MNRIAISRTRARVATRVAQAGCLALAAGAVGLLAIGPGSIPEPDQPEARAPEQPKAPPASAGDAEPPAIDLTLVAEAFQRGLPEPTKGQKTPVRPLGRVRSGSSPSNPSTEDDALAYLGSISIGSRRAALIRVAGRQRIVRPGARIDEQTTLLAIDADRIFIEDATGRHSVDQAPRSATLVSTAVAPPGSGSTPPRPGTDAARLRAEREAIANRTRQMTPEQRAEQIKRREKIRQAAQERLKRSRAGLPANRTNQN